MGLSRLAKNTLANFAESGWMTLMSLMFVPLYIYYLGIEAYGLIGVFATLQVIIGLLDAGLGSAINRETAKLVIIPGKNQELRDLLRTLEIPYWLMAVTVGTFVVILAPILAHSWLKLNNLTESTVSDAIVLMGINMALRWPLSLYYGGLQGLQKQVLINFVKIIIATLNSFGAILILWLISPTLHAFFLWQIITSGINVIIITILHWRSIPKTGHPSRFRLELLQQIYKFSIGVSGIMVLATILMQLDKIILSKMLTLEMFGYYTLANVVAMSLYRIITPFFSATYPKFTTIVTAGTDRQLATLYHSVTQWVSVILFPVAMVIIFNSWQIMNLWTQNEFTADSTYMLVSVLAFGTMLNGIMNIPYALQLANGWTSLSFYINLVSVFVLAPTTVICVYNFGALGAAIMWVILNIGYVIFGIQLMHKRILPSEKLSWYFVDVGIPLLTSTAIAALSKVFMPNIDNVLLVIWLATTVIIAMFATGKSAPAVWHRIVNRRQHKDL